MTETKSIYEYMSKPMIFLVSLLVGSFIMACSLTNNASAAGMSIRDDNCYSTLSAMSMPAGPLKFGMVNAIVNVPIYDWDEDRPILGIAGNTLNGYNDGLNNPARTSINPPVGYARKFNFEVTPVPNIKWVAKYLSKQLPYDIGLLASLFGGTNPVPEPNPYIANPFIYQQGAIITPSGMPAFPVMNPNPPSLNITDPDDMMDNGITGIGKPGDLQSQYPDKIHGAEDLANGSDDYGSHLDSAGGLESLVNGPLGFMSQGFTVDPSKNGNKDMCYENLKSNNMVPSYAFSVVSAGIPFTIPGTLYSVLTIPFEGTFSSDGMTIYPPSLNGKYMLDCYGRGQTPTVELTPHRMGDPPRDIQETMWFGISLGVDYGLALAKFAGLGPIAGPIAAGFYMLTPPSWVMRKLPTPHTRWIDYTSGFAFGFTLNKAGLELPDYLQNRAIDYKKSNFFYIDPLKVIGGDGHDESANGESYNPDLYITLKKSYELSADIDMKTPDYHHMPDGNDIKVDVNLHKTGFRKGTSRSDPYDRDSTDKGGPTFVDTDYRKKTFSHAKVYKMVIPPGITADAIDIFRLKNEYNSPEDRYFNPIHKDVCDFLMDKLENGDHKGQAPPVRGTNANGSKLDRSKVDCGVVSKYDDGSSVPDPIPVRMTENDSTLDLYDHTEHIDAETPPGTKICYAVWLDHYGNDVKFDQYVDSYGKQIYPRWWGDGSDSRVRNYNPDYYAEQDTSYLSRPRCIVSGYKPSFQVRGGDFIEGKNVYTVTNNKEYYAGTGLRTYGSWAEYGILAAGDVKAMGSGAVYRLGMPESVTEYGNLTFSNGRSTDGSKQYGHFSSPVIDGFDKVANRFSEMANKQETQTLSGNINLHSLDSGIYILQGDVNLVSVDSDGDPATLDKNKSLILLAQDGISVNIKSNIRIPQEYDSANHISQVVITPEHPDDAYAINIDNKDNAGDNITWIDSWLINPNGFIDTCYLPNWTNAGDAAHWIPRAPGDCDSTLYINGPVSADTIYLRRDGGQDQNPDKTGSSEPDQSVPAEVFNLRPDAYIWAIDHVNSGKTKYITTYVKDLPPRY